MGMVAKNYSSVDNERDLIEAFQVSFSFLFSGLIWSAFAHNATDQAAWCGDAHPFHHSSLGV